jgi:hypothetical protein
MSCSLSVSSWARRKVGNAARRREARMGRSITRRRQNPIVLVVIFVLDVEEEDEQEQEWEGVEGD